jgi:predicted nucleic acid-binding protein
MTGFLLDTNIPSELTRPKPDLHVEQWLENADDEQLFLSVVSMGEILKGLTLAPESKRRHELQHWVDDTLRPWFQGRILPVTEPIAERWGIMAGECQLKGRPLKVADGLIAATALEHRLIVATRNVRDFADLGVRVFNPWDWHLQPEPPAWPKASEGQPPSPEQDHEPERDAPDQDTDPKR